MRGPGHAQRPHVDGVMVVAGQQVVVGDVSAGATGAVAYEVLCRRHHMRRQTVATSASLDLREPRTTV